MIAYRGPQRHTTEQKAQDEHGYLLDMPLLSRHGFHRRRKLWIWTVFPLRDVRHPPLHRRQLQERRGHFFEILGIRVIRITFRIDRTNRPSSEPFE